MKWNKAVLVRFADQDFETLRKKATENGLTMNSFIRMVVLQTLKNQRFVEFKPKNIGDV